jgi:hypothetical protein
MHHCICALLVSALHSEVQNTSIICMYAPLFGSKQPTLKCMNSRNSIWSYSRSLLPSVPPKSLISLDSNCVSFQKVQRKWKYIHIHHVYNTMRGVCCWPFYEIRAQATRHSETKTLGFLRTSRCFLPVERNCSRFSSFFKSFWIPWFQYVHTA